MLLSVDWVADEAATPQLPV